VLQKEYVILAPTRNELDLLNDDSIAEYFEKIRSKQIDILINNAGINVPQWIEEMTDENIRDTIQINLIAPIKLIRGVVGGMKKRKWGRIINISSAFGIVARGKQTLYVATKHGINGVTKALALELAPYNILVNSVCPGFAKTDMVIKRNSLEKIKSLESDIPIGRLVTPNEIAEVVRFLLSEKNTYMTGEQVVIDGGFTIK
ncbi:short-chain dehydrogenase, partial [Candidatus Gottesmanbacteria bacterium RBG_13_45_10]